MLVLRNLHLTTTQTTKSPLLSIQNIIETYDFNGLKEDVPPKKRKLHPLYANHILKEIVGVTAQTPDSSLNQKTNSQSNKVLVKPLGQSKSKNPLRLSQFISDHSVQVLSSDKHAPLFDSNYFMSYGDFKLKFYNSKHTDDLKSNAAGKKVAKTSRSVVGKCYLCDMKFASKLALAKHRSICTCKKERKFIVKALAQKLIRKVKLNKKNRRHGAVNVTKKQRVLHSCTRCTDEFVSKSALDAHLKYDHRPRPTCKLCKRIFDCRRKLIEHEEACAGLQDGEPTKRQTLGVIDFKAKTEIHMCIKCENPFSTNSELRRHKLILNKRTPIDVELSEDDSTFPSAINFEIFVKKKPVYDVITQPNPYIGNDCSSCGKIFNTSKRLKQHQVFCHEKVLKTCPFCAKQFRGTFNRNQHLSYCSERESSNCNAVDVFVVPSPESALKYSCKCGAVLDTPVALKEHLNMEHGCDFCFACNAAYRQNVVRYFGVHLCSVTKVLDYSIPMNVPSSGQCKACQKKISVRPFTVPNKHCCKLKAHTSNVSILAKVPKHLEVICRTRKKTFTNQRRLLTHHKNNRLCNSLTKSTCPLCLKRFPKSVDFVRHMQLRHSKKCCPECYHIYSHWNQVHGCSEGITNECKIDETEIKITKFDSCRKNRLRCFICFKEFFSDFKILEHLACVHSRVRPYKGNALNYRSTMASDVKKHGLESHNEETDVSLFLVKLSKFHKIVLCESCGIYYLNQRSFGRHSCQVIKNETASRSPRDPHSDKLDNSKTVELNSLSPTFNAYVCTACSKPFEKVSHSLDQDHPKVLLCDDCNEMLLLQNNAYRPSFIPKPKDLFCKFDNNNMYGKTDSLLTCQFCFQTFGSLKYFTAHRKLCSVTSISPTELIEKRSVNAISKFCGVQQGFESFIIAGQKNTGAETNTKDSCVGEVRSELLNLNEQDISKFILSQNCIPLITCFPLQFEAFDNNNNNNTAPTCYGDTIVNHDCLCMPELITSPSTNKLEVADNLAALCKSEDSVTHNVPEDDVCMNVPTPDVFSNSKVSYSTEHLDHQQCVSQHLSKDEANSNDYDFQSKETFAVRNTRRRAKKVNSEIALNRTKRKYPKRKYPKRKSSLIVSSDDDEIAAELSAASFMNNESTSCQTRKKQATDAMLKPTDEEASQQRNNNICSTVVKVPIESIDTNNKNTDQPRGSKVSGSDLSKEKKLLKKPSRDKQVQNFDIENRSEFKKVRKENKLDFKTCKKEPGAEPEKRTLNGFQKHLKPREEKDESIFRKCKRKLPAHEREKIVLESIVEKAKERNAQHVHVNSFKQSSKSLSEQGTTTGAEYRNGISNYFTDIMLKSDAHRDDSKKTEYLDGLRSRIQKQFESNGVHHCKTTAEHKRLKEKACNKVLKMYGVIDRGLPLSMTYRQDKRLRSEMKESNKKNNVNSTVKVSGVAGMPVDTACQQFPSTSRQHLDQTIFSPHHKAIAATKKKLLFNPKHLDDLRLKIRRKSLEVNVGTLSRSTGRKTLSDMRLEKTLLVENVVSKMCSVALPCKVEDNLNDCRQEESTHIDSGCETITNGMNDKLGATKRRTKAGRNAFSFLDDY